MPSDRAGAAEKHAVRAIFNDPTVEEPKKKKPALSPLEQAKKWAMDYLAHPHSEKELRDRLSRKGCTEDDISTVVALCVEYGFLDDEDYAGMIVRHYAAKGYGRGRVRMELGRRGIDRELWEAALAEMPEGTEMIDRVLAARLRGKDFSDPKERERAAAALARKGFGWDDIRGALRRYGGGDDDA